MPHFAPGSSENEHHVGISVAHCGHATFVIEPDSRCLQCVILSSQNVQCNVKTRPLMFPSFLGVLVPEVELLSARVTLF
jgi:hypothetical protein